jgi:4-amino-4-deoxy-L-arabinose transferase
MTRFRITLSVLALLAFALAFQGTRGLWEPDEGRYTGIAAHMLASGDFIHPAFNDKQRHYAKPPLTYWSIAAGIRLLGANEWGARLANALAFVATTLLVLALARTLVPARPWLPPLVYASFLLPYSASNGVTPDTLLTLCETVGVLGFVRFRESQAPARRDGALRLMWLGFGLAFLTKGPPGLLPLLAIVCFAALEQGRRGVARLASVGGLLLFAVVGLGWYALVVATEPGLATYFLRDEVVNRIFTDVHHRNAAWYGAFMVYVPTLVLGTLPWTYVAMRGARSAPRTVLSRGWWLDMLRREPWVVFLALWLLLPLIILFLSRSRLPLYVLPLFPALALLVARRLPDWRPSRLVLLLLACWIAGLVGLRVAAAHYSNDNDSRRLAQAIASSELPRPSEVIFVEEAPHWGLELYLHCDVERVRLSGAPNAAAGGDETLESELSLIATQHPLVIAKADRRSEVEDELRRLGYPWRDLGRSGRWIFLAPAIGAKPRENRETSSPSR